MNPANSRLLKNTGLLYGRLIFLTFVNLYAVRVTLEALGDIDYGVYNVIASVVASLSILTAAMSSASQRFLSFHIGRGDLEKYSHTFTLLLVVFGIFSLLMILAGEILGYFFINDWLNIPSDRLDAAYWVYQASLLAFALGIVNIPYTASIIANERMDAFAIFSVVEGVLKLFIAFLLVTYMGDRLILYGLLTALISLAILVLSIRYCHSHFRYCRYIWKWDGRIFSELSKYTGWNLFGSVSGMLAVQGQNILLNIYFGPVVNAAKAIADRIQNVIMGFSINLYTAASPQIIKSYASEDYTRAMSLVVKTSKMSFMLIFVLAFPILCNMQGLLDLWLAEKARIEYMCAFSGLILLYCMLASLEPPLSRIIQATGRIRNYQVLVGIVTLSYIPIAAVALYFGADPTMTLKILIVVMAVAHVVRLVVVHRQVGLDYGVYMREVALPIVKVAFIAIPLYLVFVSYPDNGTIWLLIANTALTGFAGIFVVAFIGLDRNERNSVIELIKSRINRNRA